MKKNTLIIACSNSKLPHVARAIDLYTGNVFQTLKRNTDSNPLEDWNILILSGKHGLLEATELIEPYNQEVPGINDIDCICSDCLKAGALIELDIEPNMNFDDGSDAAKTITYKTPALPTWQDTAIESARGLREERASEVFLDLLGQLIAGGQAVIDDNMRQPKEYPSSMTVIGYRDESFIYLLPEIALREVNKVQPLRFSTTAIGTQLKEDNLLVSGTNSVTVQRRVRGSRARLWQLKSEAMGCDTCDD